MSWSAPRSSSQGWTSPTSTRSSSTRRTGWGWRSSTSSAGPSVAGAAAPMLSSPTTAAAPPAAAVGRRKALQRGEKPPPPSEVTPPLTIDLPLTAHIPDGYVDDLNLRLALYQRLAAVRTVEEIEELARELKGRFGRLPRAVQILLYVVRLRTLAREAGGQSIQAEGGGGVGGV